MTKIPLRSKVLNKNDQIAQEIRIQLHSQKIWSINLIGSPGSGKTSLLEASLKLLDNRCKCAVIEGDVKTDNDMERIRALGIPAVQIQTGGACHLNAEQVKNEFPHLPLADTNLIIIENVGNLICPVGFDLGEDCRAVVISISEGEDKPLKYPSAFATADVMIITKSDLSPYVDVSPKKLEANALSINPKLNVFCTSAKTGEGIEHFTNFLLHSCNSSLRQK